MCVYVCLTEFFFFVCAYSQKLIFAHSQKKKQKKKTFLAPISIPSEPTSMMDGYAVISKDGPGIYPVISINTAGNIPTIQSDNNNDKNKNQNKNNDGLFMLKPGEISYITTGAPLPNGSDAVVKVEDTTIVTQNNKKQNNHNDNDNHDEQKNDNQKKTLNKIQINVKVKPQTNVRNVGTDVNKGEIIFKKHEIIKNAEIGILASLGISAVNVFSKPIVGIFSSGFYVFLAKLCLFFFFNIYFYFYFCYDFL